MASEILVEESILKSAGAEQLKAIDVGALAMTFFVILNPDQKNPFQYEKACDAGLNVSDALLYFLRKKTMPSLSQKYEEIQALCCNKLRYVFFNYLEFNSTERATINEIMENFAEDSRACLIAQRQWHLRYDILRNKKFDVKKLIPKISEEFSIAIT